MSTQVKVKQVVTDDEAFAPATVEEWRAWLAQYGRIERSVWVVVHRKGSAAGIDLAEAVEHALCFGWIDSKTLSRDGQSTYQTFTPRNPRSTWSQVNRDRVERLLAAGLMEAPGQELLDLAHRTGTWDCLAEAQNGVVPADLQARLDADEEAATHFAAFPPSSRRRILEWIALAKRPETRERRIAQAVDLAALNQRANHPG
ncbi:YdeI/OmpD-associated family protein [Kribbella sp. CA-293567]|uniref:YdeI/OmpD-associated family protein n=1 Tax=Kribbella sp. CA-293567 TaxID=3002436 RepID=UPI0022DD2BE2|nr:YdeI/OmpD-associated family protein [Kribbella sp. CA-293567]WBQ06642.1 YdeI/OmpD-associated family protein [Kribbella sp. CA-293567]